MKKALWLVLVLVLAVSCQDKERIQATPYSSDEGLWGLVSDKGDTIVRASLPQEPTAAVGKRFFMRGDGGLWQIYTLEGEPQRVGDTEFVDICPFTDEVTPAVMRNGHVVLVDKDGNVVAQLEQKVGQDIERAWPFHCGLAMIETATGYGYIDTDGAVVVQPTLASANPCREDLMLVQTQEDAAAEPELFSVLDTDGELAFRLSSQYSPCTSGFKDGALLVYTIDKKLRYLYINKKGEEMTDRKFGGTMADLEAEDFALDVNIGSEYVSCDYLDIDALLDSVGVERDAVAGYGCDMTPYEAVRLWAQRTPGNPSKSPANFSGRSKLAYTQEISDGVILNAVADYRGSLVYEEEYIDTVTCDFALRYNWIGWRPSVLAFTLSGRTVADKTDLISDALRRRVKTFGTVRYDVPDTLTIDTETGLFTIVRTPSMVKLSREYHNN